ncbi:unnamed protein product, partial [Meganyctiphanes norvegica]
MFEHAVMVDKTLLTLIPIMKSQWSATPKMLDRNYSFRRLKTFGGQRPPRIICSLHCNLTTKTKLIRYSFLTSCYGKLQEDYPLQRASPRGQPRICGRPKAVKGQPKIVGLMVQPQLTDYCDTIISNRTCKLTKYAVRGSKYVCQSHIQRLLSAKKSLAGPLIILNTILNIYLAGPIDKLKSFWRPKAGHIYLTGPLGQLQGNLNLESAPCENFWDYTCGGWLEDNPIPPTRSTWSVQNKLKYQALGEMRELLDTMDEPEDVNSIEWKLKTFYWSCMNVRSYMKSGLDLLRRKIITELHGWNLMRETWDLRRWDFDQVLTKLHSMYGVSPFFQVTVVPNPRKAGHNIIKLLPSGFAMPHRSYYDRMPNNEVEMAYKQYIKDTVKLFDASGPDAIEFAAHLFHYESRIAEITPSAEHLADPHASNIIISIGELSQIARSVPWLDLLRKIFPNSKLDHRTDVLIVSRNYFSDLSELISTTDRGLLNNYLIFSFVTAYMPYLSADNKRVLDLYQQEFTGMKDPMERWEFCIETTNKFFGYGLGSLYERSHNRAKAREKNTEVVHHLFHQIRNTLGYNLANSRWYPLETKEFLVAKLNNMSVAVGYPERLLNPAVIDEYYKGYTIFTKDFFQNLQDSIRNAREQMELKLIDPMPESEWMEGLSSNTVTYQQEANKIVIPTHLLNTPLFHRNYPNAMLYGGLGVQIGRRMLESMDSVGLSWNARGQLVDRDHFTNRSLDNMRGVSECVGSATLDLALEEDAVVVRTAKDTAAEIDAVRQTYQAYLHLMRREPQPQHPSFENLNTTNIFFMAYSASLCSDQTVEQEDISRTCSLALMPKPRLEAVLSQMPEFSSMFECPPNSRHSPHTQCTPLH